MEQFGGEVDPYLTRRLECKGEGCHAVSRFAGGIGADGVGGEEGGGELGQVESLGILLNGPNGGMDRGSGILDWKG